ncbi:MAG: DUF4253 domain-containing protein [Nitrospirota bacterium]
MAGRHLVIIALVLITAVSCSNGDKPLATGKKAAPTVILRPKPKVMTAEQRAELGFSPDIIAQVEAAGNAQAEPFFDEVMIRSSNLKGDVMIATARLSGFSVRSANADRIIMDLAPSFRKKGYLIFRSQQNFGNVPDVITVVRGNNSYDILLIQRTEAPRHHLDTKKIIKWLKEQQKLASFVITGAGSDWLEARFIKPPKNMKAFARKVAAFSPDVLAENKGTLEKLVDTMERTGGFSLWWD